MNASSYILTGALALVAACSSERPITPIEVPVTGHVSAVIDRWTPSCSTPASIYPAAWDSTLADTAVIFAAPLDVDTIGSLFGVTRRADGLLGYDSEGRGGDPLTGTEALRVGVWTIVEGSFERRSYVDDIELPVDSLGRSSPEEYRQSWLYAFAPTRDACAVVVAWRSPRLGSYRGPRFAEYENHPDSLAAFVNRIRWRTP